MAEGFGAAVGEKIAGYLVKPIASELDYLFSYNSNIKKLKNELKDLEDAKKGAELTSKHLAKRTLQDPLDLPAAKTWMGRVTTIHEEGDQVLERTTKVEKGCCWNGWCPNIKQRYHLSKKAVKQTKYIIALRTEGKRYSDGQGDVEPSVGMLHAPLSEGPSAIKSRMSMLKNVLIALETDQISVLGICGMPGVGKTTLVKEVLNRVLDEKLFDEVAMVVVSQNSVSEIQDELAETLALEFDVTSKFGRARKLYKRFTGNSKVLVILDDVWEPFELGDIGFPVAGDHKGSKVVIASRMETVCTKMGAQKFMTVNTLPPDEAWDLLKMKAGECVEKIALRSTAEKVLKECGGLPIAIVTLGKALENRKLPAWQDALHKLQNPSAASQYDKLYQSIQLSYTFLGTREPQAQPLLMLCCLFAEDANIPVEKLVRYAKGLNLITNVTKLADLSNRVYTLLEELRSCSLLIPGDKDMTVKMHDIVRQACLLMKSNKYVVKHDLKLQEWKHQDGQKPYRASSFASADEMNEHPSLLDFDPKLQLFQLQLHGDSSDIPNDLFQGMTEVSVADFTAVPQWSECLRTANLLPPLKSLMNLRTLSLEFCNLSGDIVLIGSFVKLEVLSFFSSKLDELPFQIRELRNLKLLDLRCTNGPDNPTIIPGGVLSELKKLEDLYLGIFDSWHGEKDDKQGERRGTISIMELSVLSQLKTLQFRVKDPNLLQEFESFCFENLQRFHIEAIRREQSFLEYKIERTLTFDGADKSLLAVPKMLQLLRSTEHLTLNDTSFEDIFKLCANLKTLKLSWFHEVEYIMDARDSAPALNSLKHLHIESMDQLKEIGKGNLSAGSLAELETVRLETLPLLTHLWRAPIQPAGCLGNLRALEISDCESITSIFPVSIAKCLVQLQRLALTTCFKLESVVSSGGVTDKILFPNLSFLLLNDLPDFRSFSVGTEVETKELTVEKTTTRKKGEGCLWFNRKKYATSTEEPSATGLLHPASEDSNIRPSADSEGNHKSTTPCLFNQQVELQSMSELQVHYMNLKHIMDGQTQAESVSKLRVLNVDECEELIDIAASESINLLQSLEQVKVQNCPALKVVFDFDGFKVDEAQNTASALGKLETVSLRNLSNLQHVWRMVPDNRIQSFKNLRFMEISGCMSLRYLISPSTAKMLENLQHLQIKGCVILEEIIGSTTDGDGTGSELIPCTIMFPQLRVLQLESLDSITSFSSGNHDFEFPELQKVVIRNCPRMNIFCKGQVLSRTHQFVEDASVRNTVEQSKLARENTSVQKTQGCPWLTRKKLNRFTTESRGTRVLHPAIEDSKLTNSMDHKEIDNSTVQSLFNQLVGLPSIKELNVYSMNNLKLIVDLQTQATLTSRLKVMLVDGCKELLKIAASDSIRLFQQLEQVKVENCHALEVLFDFSGSKLNVRNADSRLGKLERVSLHNLKNLQQVWRTVPDVRIQGFKNLKFLEVSDCHSLRHLASLSQIKLLENLQHLILKRSAIVEEIIEPEEGHSIELITDTITFPQLRELVLSSLASLTSFCNGNNDFEFPKLHNLLVKECPSMNVFCRGQVKTPNLQRVRVGDGDDQWIRIDVDLNNTIRNLNSKRYSRAKTHTTTMNFVSNEIEV